MKSILYGTIKLPIKACTISLSILGTITIFIFKKLFTLILPRNIQGNNLNLSLELILNVLEAYVRTNSLSDPSRECEDFVRSFNGKYGEVRPNFVELEWREAALQANRESKFLFVYIHSPEHQV